MICSLSEINLYFYFHFSSCIRKNKKDNLPRMQSSSYYDMSP